MSQSAQIEDAGRSFLPRARPGAWAAGIANGGRVPAAIDARSTTIRSARSCTIPAGDTVTPSAASRAICWSRRAWRPIAPPLATTRCQALERRSFSSSAASIVSTNRTAIPSCAPIAAVVVTRPAGRVAKSASSLVLGVAGCLAPDTSHLTSCEQRNGRRGVLPLPVPRND